MSTYGNVEKECPIPEPFGTNLWNLIAIALLFFLSFIVRFIFAPLMPTIENELGMTHAQAGSLFLMISIGMFISQCLSGYFTSWLKHRGTLFVSTLGLGLPLLWLYIDSSLLSLFVIMFIIGLAAGLHMPSAIATITAMVTRQDWGKALGIHGSAPPLGLAMGPFLAVILLNYFSWQSIVIFIGIITIVAAFAFLRYCSCGEFPGEPPRFRVVSAVLSQRSFWIMVILFALFLGGNIGIYAMLSLYLIQEAGISPDLANSLVGLSRLSGLIITFLSGVMMDRIGEKKHIVWVMVAAGLSTILLGTTSGILLIVLIFIQPALLGCFPTAGFSALARTVQPNLRSTATSFMAPFSFLIGGGITPTLLGYMGEAYSFSTGIILIGCLITIGPVLVFPLKLLDNLEAGC
jgi:predicted MFS family arabinose efflux permease